MHDGNRSYQNYITLGLCKYAGFSCKEKATYDDKCDFDLLIYQE